MGFALNPRAREQVVRNIANLQTFKHGGISGRQGGTRHLERLPRQYANAALENAVYVVYCYGTPIAWVSMADDATEEGRVNYLPDWQYSPTTTYHQGLVWEAWGDKIVDPDPRYSKQENRGTARGRSSDERYGRVPRRAPAPRRVVNHRGVSYDPRVERDTSYERDMAEARAARRSLGYDTPRGDRMTVDFRAQDDLMDEVHGYRHPAHP